MDPVAWRVNVEVSAVVVSCGSMREIVGAGFAALSPHAMSPWPQST